MQQEKSKVSDAITPSPQVRRSVAAILAECDGDFSKTQPCEMRLYDQFRGELHLGGAKLKALNRLAGKGA
jgi:hypothetical protein